MNRFVAIDIEQLRIGMYVHLEMGWLSHPFPVNSFKISSQEQLQTLQSLPLSQIRIDPTRSDPQPETDAEDQAAAQSLQQPPAPNPLDIWREQLQSVQQRFQSALSCFDSVQSFVPANLPTARQHSDAAVDDYVVQLAGDSDISLHLMFGDTVQSASLHGVNTAVMALLLGKSLGFQGQALHDLGTAALLHDLGKISLNIPASDYAQMLQGAVQPPLPYVKHVGESVALTQAMGYTPSVTTAIAQHHEWADGSGFPLGLLAADMDLAGQILALVNNYERLCNPPSGKAGLTPHEALASLYGQYRHRYAPEALRGFVQTLGVYPPGSWVEMSDGCQGLVVSVNTRHALKPTVLVYKPDAGQDGQQLVELAQQVDLGIRRGLHRDQISTKALSALQPQRYVCYFFDSSSATAAEKASS